jgi:hypothetical protein
MQKSIFEEGTSSKTLHGQSWFHSDNVHIQEALKDHPNIKIEMQNGTVELTGICSDHQEERAIIDTLENISGVRRVVSHLDVLSDRG